MADGEASTIPWGDTRPQTRGECLGRPRPCPWVSCSHHLALALVSRAMSDDAILDVTETRSCALDVAEAGGATLAEVGEVLLLTREGIRRIEASALRTLAATPTRARRLRLLLDETADDPQHASAHGGGSVGAVPRAADPEPCARPARHADLPSPDAIRTAADSAWCGQIGAVVTGKLCRGRHGASGYGAPLFPTCARCDDGAQITAHLDGRGARVHLPVITETAPDHAVIDMRDDAPIPLAPQAQPASETTAMTSIDTKLEDSLDPSHRATCAVCGEAVPPPVEGSATAVWGKDLCPRHRQPIAVKCAPSGPWPGQHSELAAHVVAHGSPAGFGQSRREASGSAGLTRRPVATEGHRAAESVTIDVDHLVVVVRVPRPEGPASEADRLVAEHGGVERVRAILALVARLDTLRGAQ